MGHVFIHGRIHPLNHEQVFVHGRIPSPKHGQLFVWTKTLSNAWGQAVVRGRVIAFMKRVTNIHVRIFYEKIYTRHEYSISIANCDGAATHSLHL